MLGLLHLKRDADWLPVATSTNKVDANHQARKLRASGSKVRVRGADGQWIIEIRSPAFAT